MAFDPAAATAANGVIPANPTAAGVCGSSTATYLAELISGNPLAAKVLTHWADIVAGKEMMVSGVVHQVNRGLIDLPFDHPWSGDLTFDIGLDPEYAPLAKVLGPSTGGGGSGRLHVELEQGQLPHVVRDARRASGQTWLASSTANAKGVQNGFVPREGDRVAAMGRWIIDCGHPDYSAELHPLTFLAFGHSQGGRTVTHVLANPYRVAQVYTPDPSATNLVNDAARLAAPGVKTFTAFFVDEVLRLIGAGPPGGGCCTDHLRAPVDVEATRPAPAPWLVCAPKTATENGLTVTSRFVTRPGVKIRLHPNPANGCVRVETRIGPSYIALDPPLRDCVMPWDFLNQQAAAAAGVPSLDVRSVIKSFVPPAFQSKVDINPTTNCFDALAGPTLGPPGQGHSVEVRADQPFPFYGVIEVGRHR
ncbi:MAG: hypothetical protein IVW52_17555 [Acidimicrobiales bacterium]|nr:hypothetical protein [Acidimicrobiales bacterium]